jgi:hypothetical protein
MSEYYTVLYFMNDFLQLKCSIDFKNIGVYVLYIIQNRTREYNILSRPILLLY